MTYWMYKQVDGDTHQFCGDSGPMCLGLYRDEDGEVVTEHHAYPRVGIAMRVGSLYGRSFSAQDWWQCTFITEILEEKQLEPANGDGEEFWEVRFKTQNSEYLWRGPKIPQEKLDEEKTN